MINKCEFLDSLKKIEKREISGKIFPKVRTNESRKQNKAIYTFKYILHGGGTTFRKESGMKKGKKSILALLFICLMGVSAVSSMAFAQDVTDFEDFSLEDLLNITVTSAGGREQNKMEVSNAMTVMTREDIERSGARTIQDLFYRVPGMQVRQWDGHNYAISSRAPASLLTNTMLILVDGIIVFNPATSGTVWSSVPVTLNEIERIEIIRGPGGVLYSSNAVAGVINIMTKAAEDTGKYVSVQTGSQYYVKTSMGGGIKPFDDKELYVRGYFEFNEDEGFRKRGATGNTKDDLEAFNYGFRSEYKFDDDSKLTATFKQARVEDDSLGALARTATWEQDFRMTATSISYNNKVNDNYDFDVSYWYNQHLATSFQNADIKVDANDIKTQHNFYFDLAGKHVLSLGAEMVYNRIDAGEDYRVRDKTQRVASGFIQEEYRPVDNVILTAGIRVDNNTNIKERDWQWQPRLSAMYLPTENHSIRAVFSRTTRQNAYNEQEVQASLGGGLTYIGTSDIKPEDWWNYEIGYRGLLFDSKLSINADMFYSFAKNYVISHNDALSTTINVANNGDMNIYGFEFDMLYHLNQDFSLFADYTYINMRENTNFPSAYTEGLVNGLANHLIGGGIRYTKGAWKVDLYGKLMDRVQIVKQPYQATTPGDIEIGWVFENSFRVAYEFDVPSTEDVTAEIELVANDMFDHRRVETGRKYFIKPQIFGGVKIKF